MGAEGYNYYERFCERPPLLVVEWHDTDTEAVGWLVINSLKNGAAGGGTRMREFKRDEDPKQEAIWLAKTMEIKFTVSGPSIGGAKSVINFNSQDPRKEGVLRRWVQNIAPYLWHCYGTGGDLGVDEIREVIPLTRDMLGLRHPQEGIVRGHIKTNEKGYYRILTNLKRGVEMPLSLGNDHIFAVADMVTGYGLSRALHYYYESRGASIQGKRVLIEGFGAVGGSAAYYLAEAGAKVVGILSLSPKPDSGTYRWMLNSSGLNDVKMLLHQRDGKHLPPSSSCGDNPIEFWQTNADIFIPAAGSHTITLERLNDLKNAGIKVIAGGANNPFDDRKLGSTEVQQKADAEFTVIADFIANCGMARTFAYLMNEEARVDADAIFADVDRSIYKAMKQLLEEYDRDVGLLGRAYSLCVPH